ncbi:MAG: hypothetical protein KH009_01600 [Clostridiales bacterium]|nr:hypothetical protein [Clostridiales bacterium]
MDQAFLQRLEQWHQEDAFEKIIQAIEEIPREQWGTGLTGLLARAYSNAARGGERPEYHEKAMELLNSAPEEGEPDWNFRMGFALYWLDREREAASYFRRVLELIPEDPESQAHWADCRELLAVCEEEAEKRELTARYLADPMNEQLALDYLLRCDLHGSLMTPDVLENGRICLPEWRLTLRPEVEQLQPNAVSLNFYLSSPDWDDPLFECSVALGADTHQALGLASGSFRFSFLQGIARMAAGEEPHEELDTTFAGAPHHWSVYLSNVVGLGNSPQLEGPQVYWNALRDGILRRLGNQKLCYVKVYGAKVNGEVTGECRIDDVKSEELSAVVAKLVESWEVEDFASHKMFFFLRQREDTILPNPYSGTGYSGRRSCSMPVTVRRSMRRWKPVWPGSWRTRCWPGSAIFSCRRSVPKTPFPSSPVPKQSGSRWGISRRYPAIRTSCPITGRCGLRCLTCSPPGRSVRKQTASTTNTSASAPFTM